MTIMKNDQTFRYKDGVASHNWIAHLVDSHSDSIQKQVYLYVPKYYYCQDLFSLLRYNVRPWQSMSFGIIQFMILLKTLATLD